MSRYRMPQLAADITNRAHRAGRPVWRATPDSGAAPAASRAACLLAAVLLAAGGLWGCADEGRDPGAPEMPDDTIEYASAVQPLWDAHCGGCHGAGGLGGLDLRSAVSYENLVGVASSGYAYERVVAGQPDESLLYLKLIGAADVGDVMPPAGALPAADLATVRQWIEQLADP